jgi:hypothetical protein
MTEGASLRDRAGRASPRAAARLGHPATITCADCGRFISYADCLDGARFRFEPLSEFGPERSEWICKRCNETPREAGDANNAPASNQ